MYGIEIVGVFQYSTNRARGAYKFVSPAARRITRERLKDDGARLTCLNRMEEWFVFLAEGMKEFYAQGHNDHEA